MKTRSLLMALALASCASSAMARDICHCKGYAGPGGPGGPAYSGPGGPCYGGPGGACYSGPGGTGDDCPSLCR